MRNWIFYFLLILLSSYDPYIEPAFESEFRPILMDRATLENSVEFISPQPLTQPGKIYIKDDLLFINERYIGIHIINNADPLNPVKLGFLRVPGCVDMAVKGNTLYADNAVDLIAVNISDVNSINVSSRIRNIFPELIPPDGYPLPDHLRKENRPENTIIVAWKR